MLQKFAGWHDEHLHEFQVNVVNPELDSIVVDGLTPDGEPLEKKRGTVYWEQNIIEYHIGTRQVMEKAEIC